MLCWSILDKYDITIYDFILRILYDKRYTILDFIRWLFFRRKIPVLSLNFITNETNCWWYILSSEAMNTIILICSYWYFEYYETLLYYSWSIIVSYRKRTLLPITLWVTGIMKHSLMTHKLYVLIHFRQIRYYNIRFYITNTIRQTIYNSWFHTMIIL